MVTFKCQSQTVLRGVSWVYAVSVLFFSAGISFAAAPSGQILGSEQDAEIICKAMQVTTANASRTTLQPKTPPLNKCKKVMIDLNWTLIQTLNSLPKDKESGHSPEFIDTSESLTSDACVKLFKMTFMKSPGKQNPICYWSMGEVNGTIDNLVSNGAIELFAAMQRAPIQELIGDDIAKFFKAHSLIPTTDFAYNSKDLPDIFKRLEKAGLQCQMVQVFAHHPKTWYCGMRFRWMSPSPTKNGMSHGLFQISIQPKDWVDYSVDHDNVADVRLTKQCLMSC